MGIFFSKRNIKKSSSLSRIKYNSKFIIDEIKILKIDIENQKKFFNISFSKIDNSIILLDRRLNIIKKKNKDLDNILKKKINKEIFDIINE